MSQALNRIAEQNFMYGYNDKDKPEALRKPDGTVYMADIKNGFIDQNKIVKRTGYTSIGNAPVSKAILGQASFEPAGGSKYIVRARNNSGDTNAVVESWSGSGNWSALTGASAQTASLNHEFVMAKEAMYIFNGTDTVLKTTDGTTTSTVAAIPKGKQGFWFHNFFFVIGVTGNLSRLYFSDVNAPETFPADNFIDINPGDGQTIIGFGVLADTLLLFKDNRVWGLTGFGTIDFTVNDISERIEALGTIAPRSILSTGNEVYYITYQGQTPHIRTLKRSQFGNIVNGDIISIPITGSMNRIIGSRINQTASVFDGRRAWFSVCTSGSTNNEIFVYDTYVDIDHSSGQSIPGGWVRLTGINSNVFHISSISGKNQMYFGSSTASGKSYILDSSVNDDGTAIDFSVDTPAYAPQPGHKARYKYFYITADVGANMSLTIQKSPDGFTFDTIGVVMLTGSGATFGTAIFGTSKFGATTIARDRLNTPAGTAYYMQYRISNSGLTDSVTIRDWEIFYKVRSLRDIN
jgi:hypothetical protein